MQCQTLASRARKFLSQSQLRCYLTEIEVAERSGYETEAAFVHSPKRVIWVGPGAVRQQPATS